MKCDVAIIGGGPAGSTLGSLLKRYQPHLKVVILERERFPREHVGESLLPPSCEIMHETGAWDKVEAANFPVKLGATFRWGSSKDFFDFTFLPGELFENTDRPARYEGQRVATAFQVDRSVFDKLLLDHAAEMGCKVFEESRVVKVHTAGSRVRCLEVESDQIRDGRLEARHYVDAGGVSSTFRRAFDVKIDSPTALRNIAIWDYWQGADWARRTGKDGTSIQIMSLGWGWLWFITIGNTRTSVGLVTPAAYFKESGLTREEIYLKAVQEEPHISGLLKGAVRENSLQADRDWSYIADRLVGENWFLAGDSCGFADPILSAGMTLAMSGARKVAYSILEIERGELDEEWLRSEYERTQKRNIQNHIRFADYWYSANTMFTDLKEYCTEIARDAGLSLNANDAFRWIGTGGFTDDIVGGLPSTGTYRLSAVKQTVTRFSGEIAEWETIKFNCLRLNIEGSERLRVATCRKGRIVPVECYRRSGHTLVLEGLFGFVVEAMGKDVDARRVMNHITALARPYIPGSEMDVFHTILEVLEAMIIEGWIEASVVAGLGYIKIPSNTAMVARR